MSREIRPLAPEDIPELGRFLAAGFHTTPDADFAASEVLRWKYLATTDAAGPEAALSYVARDDSGRIIGHLGLCRTAFEGRALAAAGGRVGTIHIIDWLGSPEHKAVGMRLMWRAHQGIAAPFGLGVSQAALVVGERAGYELRSLVPVYTRVLRARYWLRAAGLTPWRRALAMARDAAYRVIRPPATPRRHRAAASLELRTRDPADHRGGQGARDPDEPRPGSARCVPEVPSPGDVGLAPAR